MRAITDLTDLPLSAEDPPLDDACKSSTSFHFIFIPEKNSLSPLIITRVKNLHCKIKVFHFVDISIFDQNVAIIPPVLTPGSSL